MLKSKPGRRNQMHVRGLHRRTTRASDPGPRSISGGAPWEARSSKAVTENNVMRQAQGGFKTSHAQRSLPQLAQPHPPSPFQHRVRPPRLSALPLARHAVREAHGRVNIRVIAEGARAEEAEADGSERFGVARELDSHCLVVEHASCREHV